MANELVDKVAAAPSAQSTEQSEPTEAKAPELPMASFVKGGTPTAASERLFEERYQQSEKRRNEADEDKRIGATPIEQGGGRIYANKWTSNPEIPQAYVRLVFYGEGECFGPMLCEVMIENWSNPNDLTIQLECPRCLGQGVKHEQDCQISLKMSNRRWHLAHGAGPKTFVFAPVDEPPKVYNSAGVVTESEPFNCPSCSWRGRIVNNRIITER